MCVFGQTSGNKLCMVSLKILDWRNLKMVFPESKNNAFILVARPFCNQ